MLQGFYMLALKRAKRQRRIALILCAAALVCAFFAARRWFSAPAVTVSAPVEPYLAYSADGTLAVDHGGETVLYPDIDTRTLPKADRDALAEGIRLPDAEALARLLEDYGS